MSEVTAISWTNATINFWTGCTKVSAGCKYCYMYRDKDRFGLDGSVVIKVSQTTINRTLLRLEELRMKRLQMGITERLKIFTCSWSDFFIEDMDDYRDWAWDIIRKHKQFDWQILTKRIERVEKCLPDDWHEGWDHVWLGVSIEDQSNMWRLDVLASIKSKVRFVSAEPLLSMIYFGFSDGVEKIIHWVIFGGESGNDSGIWRYRYCAVEWIVNGVKQCLKFSIPVFVKQLGSSIANNNELKNKTGADIAEYVKFYDTQYLSIRQMPKTYFTVFTL